MGKLYRTVLYTSALSEADVRASYNDALAHGIPEPTTLSLFALAGVALLRDRQFSGLDVGAILETAQRWAVKIQ